MSWTVYHLINPKPPKMRKLILPLLFLIPFIASAQRPTMPKDSVTGKVSYTEVIQVSGVGQEELYSRAREFFAKAYNSAQSVIQMDSREDGKIVGKAVIPMYFRQLGKDHPVGVMNYTLTIAAKDGRYKYEITDFYHKAGIGQESYDRGTIEEIQTNPKKSVQAPFTRFLQDTDSNAKTLAAEIKRFMSSPSVKKEDW